MGFSTFNHDILDGLAVHLCDHWIFAHQATCENWVVLTVLPNEVRSDQLIVSQKPLENSESIVKYNLRMEAESSMSVDFLEIHYYSVEGVDIKVRAVDSSSETNACSFDF